MFPRFRLRILDIAVVLAALASVAGAVYWTTGTGEGMLMVEVKTFQERLLYPLSEDKEIRVEGPIGSTVIVIQDGSARVTASDCKEKIAIKMGEINKPGSWVACLPNRVFVQVMGVNSDFEAADVGVF